MACNLLQSLLTSHLMPVVAVMEGVETSVLRYNLPGDFLWDESFPPGRAQAKAVRASICSEVW